MNKRKRVHPDALPASENIGLWAVVNVLLIEVYNLPVWLQVTIWVVLVVRALIWVMRLGNTEFYDPFK